MPTTRLDNAVVLTMEPGATPVHAGTVVVENERIVYAGPADSAPATPDATVVDCAGGVLLPGLVNAHTHVAMTLLRGYADDMPLKSWLEDKIWPLEAKLLPEDVYWGTLLGIAEMLRGGVTCCCDMYHFFRESTRAMVDGGIRGCPSGVLLGFQPHPERLLDDARAFVLEIQAQQYPRLHPMFGPHAPYTCTDEILREVRQEALKLGVPIHIHVSETQHEVEESLAQYGMTPVERLDRLGLFEARVTAAHCVHLTDHDFEILAEKRVGVAHCPGSNLKLASGFAPVSRLLAAGAVVGLGTDGCASNNNLDMFQEILLAGLLDKAVLGDPTTMPAETVLALATREAARVVGLEDRIGTLTPGKLADLILVDLSRPHLQPLHNVVSHLAYAARADDVKLTMVHGKILYRDGRLTQLDEAEVIARANESARRLTA
ncbi:MAG TPA: amidohydrolase [Armatimonadota bacterium]|jgi:5-methylthioadenosine/S-adenosylhomocysteine deaminase